MLFETLKTVLSVYGPSGDEGKVASAVKKLLAGSVDSAKIDVMGNLIMEKKGQPDGKTILLSAHMDQIGLIVTNIDKHGFVRVDRSGGIDRHHLTPHQSFRLLLLCALHEGVRAAVPGVAFDIALR